LIKVMMRKERDKRQQSWDEVEKDIRLAIKGNMPVSVKDSLQTKTMKRPRSGKSFAASRANVQVQKASRAPMFITVFLVLACAGGGTYYMLQERAKDKAEKAALLKAKNDEIRKRNKQIAEEKAKRFEQRNLVVKAWANVTASIRKLDTAEKFVLAQEALNQVIALETSASKLDYAKKLVVSVEERRIERIGEVMAELNGQASKIASGTFDVSEAFGRIQSLYSDYSGPFAAETAEPRNIMLGKYTEKMQGAEGSTTGGSKKFGSAVKGAVQYILDGAFDEALESLSSMPKYRKHRKIVEVLAQGDKSVLKGVSLMKGVVFKLGDTSCSIDSVDGDGVKVNYKATIGGRKIASKKVVAVEELPLSVCYKALAKVDEDSANLFAALEFLKKGSSDKAVAYIEKLSVLSLKKMLLKNLDQ